MTQPLGFSVRAEARAERGTATECACGGLLGLKEGTRAWECLDCGRVYK